MKLTHTVTSLMVLAIFTCVHPSAIVAEIKIPSIIGDSMVLQRGEEVPIWGRDDPGVEVTVSIAGLIGKAKADNKGKWMVRLPAMKAGGPHDMSISGSSNLKLTNILIGEVWLCSGQSNMEWTVGGSQNAKAEIAAANYPKIRHIKIPHIPADKPQDDVQSKGWQEASPKTAGGFTAVGFYFARHLQKELDGVPIGLIGSNWGGTRIEPWTPPIGFKSVPALKSITDKLGEYPTKRNNGSINHQSPLALYNGMINPLVPYAIRGALWYQGESNNGEGMMYYEKMKALIVGWRAIWKKEDLPFYYVQLAPFRYGGDPTRLAGIWEAQLKTLTVPHTGMAVTVDIGNVRDIHPRNKQDVGKRLALWALAKNYGKKLTYSGPLYKSMKIEGRKAILSFEHVGGGLCSRDDKALSHFTIAGEDKKFVAATATIQGKTVVVESADVDKPIAVRFAWHQEAEPNLSNRDGLPASPFRTDN